jgi:hypothetical protein
MAGSAPLRGAHLVDQTSHERHRVARSRPRLQCFNLKYRSGAPSERQPFAFAAVAQLHAKGYDARRLEDGSPQCKPEKGSP